MFGPLFAVMSVGKLQMELKHIGVLRLHSLASTKGQLSLAEADHLYTCDGCMEVFGAFMQQLHGEGHFSKREPRAVAEDELVTAGSPWAL